MTALDLPPTVMNLRGIDYKRDYVLGNDVFVEDYNGFCFDEEVNCFNTDFYFSSTTNEIKTYNGYSKNLAEQIILDYNKKEYL